MTTRFTDFLCRFSGIRPDALRAAPSGRLLASTQGLLLLIVGAFSAAAAGYAAYRVFITSEYAWLAAAAIGPLWGALIVCLDRSLALSFDPDAPPWSKAGAAAARLALAAVVAAAISTPLILRVVEPVLDANLRQRQRDQVQVEAAQNASAEGLPNRQETLRRLETQIDDQRRRLRGEPDTVDYRRAVSAREQAAQRYDTTAAANSQRIAAARRELATLAASEVLAESGEARRRLLQASVRTWQRQVSSAAAARQEASEEVDRIQREWFADEKARLGRLEESREPAEVEVQRASGVVAELNDKTERALAELMEPTLISQYQSLRRITNDPAHPDRAAVVQVEWALHLLWFLIEAAVLLTKVFWPRTDLDTAITAATAVSDERITAWANAEVARIQDLYAAWLDIERRITKKWSSAHLGAMPSKRRELRARRQQIRDERDAMVREGSGATPIRIDSFVH
jgi:hypothetical protein